MAEHDLMHIIVTTPTMLKAKTDPLQPLRRALPRRPLREYIGHRSGSFRCRTNNAYWRTRKSLGWWRTGRPDWSPTFPSRPTTVRRLPPERSVSRICRIRVLWAELP